MKMAVMQPYLFPYIGYFQLIKAVNQFVIFDDVTHIKKGWINRNRILVNGKPHMFTVPLRNNSQNILIRDLKVSVTDSWYKKILKTLEYSYLKAPYYSTIVEIIKDVIFTPSIFLIDWQLNSFNRIIDYLSIHTGIVSSSGISNQDQLRGEERIIDICRRHNCKEYINLSGGSNLYNVDRFRHNYLELRFLHSKEVKYRQFDSPFVPGLSIIDVLMFCSVEQILCLLDEYDLIVPKNCHKSESTENCQFEK